MPDNTQLPLHTNADSQRHKSSRFNTEFQPINDYTDEALLPASEPNSPLERAQRLLFGQPIPERLAGRERLNRGSALAILSSDALSSVAYGTEASLAVLLTAGITALSSNLIIGL